MSSLMIRDIAALVTCNDADEELHHVDLFCENGRIAAIGPELTQHDGFGLTRFALFERFAHADDRGNAGFQHFGAQLIRHGCFSFTVSLVYSVPFFCPVVKT